MPICHFSPQARADGAVRPLDVSDRGLGAPTVECAHPEFAVRNGSAGLAQACAASERSSAHLPEAGSNFLNSPASTSSSHHMPPWEAALGRPPAAGGPGAPLPTGAWSGCIRLEWIGDARCRLVCLLILSCTPVKAGRSARGIESTCRCRRVSSSSVPFTWARRPPAGSSAAPRTCDDAIGPVPVTMEILTVERIEFPVLGRLGRSRSPDIQVGERMPDERTDWHFPTAWARAAP